MNTHPQTIRAYTGVNTTMQQPNTYISYVCPCRNRQSSHGGELKKPVSNFSLVLQSSYMAYMHAIVKCQRYRNPLLVVASPTCNSLNIYNEYIQRIPCSTYDLPLDSLLFHFIFFDSCCKRKIEISELVFFNSLNLNIGKQIHVLASYTKKEEIILHIQPSP